MSTSSGNTRLHLLLALLLLAAAPMYSQVLSGALEFETQALDLETGTVYDRLDPLNADHPAVDFHFAHHAGRTPHCVVFQAAGAKIAFLDATPFESVTYDDVSSISFKAGIVDKPFGSGDTIVLRTAAGNYFKLGRASESDTSVQFDHERLNAASAELQGQQEFSLLASAGAEPAAVPAGLSAREWRQIQSLAEKAGYEITGTPKHSSFQAANRLHRMRSHFDQGGPRVAPAGGDQPAWEWGLALRAYGYEERMRTPAPARLAAAGNRLEYRRGSLVEWYINDRRGIEQGFTLNERPAADGDGELILEFGIQGSLTPELESTGEAIRFEDSEGQTVLSYGGLLAWDSQGSRLPARMHAADGALALHVDDSKAVYPVTIDPVIVNEQAKLLASDGAASDEFGGSVSVSGGRVVIGARGDDDNGSSAGAAYVFERDGTGTWSEVAKLLASDGLIGDLFGSVVSVSGGTAVIGAFGDDYNGSNAGSAYVFERDGTGAWNEVAKLLASDGAVGDLFGGSVSVSGGTAVIGARTDDNNGDSSGSAYVFERDGTGVWNEVAILLASDGAVGDEFGASVSVSGGTAVIGAQRDDDNGSNSGSAYVFERDGTGVWNEVANLLASDGAGDDLFGASVSVSGGTAVIGAYRDDGDNGSDSGAAYVFERDGTGVWNEVAILLASDGAAADQFGFLVSVSGGTAVIGAYLDDDIVTNSGAAYVFERDGTGVWSEVAKLLASDASASDQFGFSVSVSGGTTVIGANRDDATASFAGSAYVFESESDSAGPITSNVLSDPSPASVKNAVTLSARIDESTTGGSNIATADFEIRDENGDVVHNGAGNNTDCPSPGHLCPVDEFGNPEASPAFDAAMEDVEVTIAAGILAPGVYEVCLRGTDVNGNVGEFECNDLAVPDPDGGSVTGEGWIKSAAGACTLSDLCESAEGNADFTFDSRYHKGAAAPTGQTEYQFTAVGLNFHSAEYEWLVVSGDTAQYKGSGTINGEGDYGFLVTATDGAINKSPAKGRGGKGRPADDTFRIKIWDKATGTVVYDNGADQPIGKGNIVIHSKKK